MLSPQGEASRGDACAASGTGWGSAALVSASKKLQNSPHLSVRRLQAADASWARLLNELFDEGMVWDASEGRRAMLEKRKPSFRGE
jgi:hypothetical protein